MYIDRALAQTNRMRLAGEPGSTILADAWIGTPPALRAAMAAAQGDLHQAAVCGGSNWAALINGKAPDAFDAARAAPAAPGMKHLEAEALFAAGLIAAGLRALEALFAQGDPAATIALVRRRHSLGDHRGAMTAAGAIPHHATAALTGARAALLLGNLSTALSFLEPFVEGLVPAPEPLTAGAIAVVVGATLARIGNHGQLRGFAERLCFAGHLPDTMLPAGARVAWTAGLAQQAWSRLSSVDAPLAVTARAELALLAADADLGRALLSQCGHLAAPSMASLAVLAGDVGINDELPNPFVAGHTVHVWRTQPRQWNPWIAAAQATEANVVVCDLAEGHLPDPGVAPDAVLDDGALVGVVEPVKAPLPAPRGDGLWLGQAPCAGIGIGHDWPESETAPIRAAFPPAPAPDRAALAFVGPDDALALVERGVRCVVAAPPGNPFWMGPLPERLWNGLRVVRADRRNGWQGAGERAVEALQALAAA